LTAGPFQRDDAFSRRFGRFARSKADEAALADIRGVRHVVAKRKELIQDGAATLVAYILHEGWMCSYKRLPDGGRQIMDIRLPGDFIGVTGLFSAVSDRDIEALTDCVVSEVDKAHLISGMRLSPMLAEAVMWNIARDDAIAAQHLVNLGRRSALGRLVYFLLELGARLHDAGKGTSTTYECPLSQQMLADTLGLTSIHLNRVLRSLREREWLTLNGGVVEFLNPSVLRQLVGFDPSYLTHVAEED
jgi:CRP-like cAMP-binding protein